MKKFNIAIICLIAVIIAAGALSVVLQRKKEPVLVSNAPPDVKITATTQPVVADAKIVMLVNSPRSLVNGKLVLIDPEDGRVIPIIANDNVLVPVRFIAEATGGKVDWNSTTKTARLTYPAQTFSITAGDTRIAAGNDSIVLGTQVKAENDRLFVPLSGLSRALGLNMSMKDGLIVISSAKIDTTSSEYTAIAESAVSRIANLKSVGTVGRLIELMKTNMTAGYGRDGGILINQSPAMAEASKAMDTTGASPSSNYSTTNVQVEGVDEGDVVKTDGKYIYAISKGAIRIINADPAAEMSVIKTLKYENNEFTPVEMYIDDKYLTVIGTYYTNTTPINAPVATGGDGAAKSGGTGSTNVGAAEPAIAPAPAIGMPAPDAAKDMIMPSYMYSYTRIYVYDISDKTNITQVRYCDIDGSYASSRKIGSALYVVSNKYNYWYGVEPAEANVLPAYRDSATGADFASVPVDKVFYFSDKFSPGYLTVAGLNLDNMEQPVNINSYLGSGVTIYASLDNLYVTYPEYASETNGNETTNQTNTHVYKFSLKEGQAIYLGNATVPGALLNQFSMDETDGNFRLATNVQKYTVVTDSSGTSMGVASIDNQNMDNNLYVYDSALNPLGRIEKIAPGERIYSVRFMGRRAYMVTYKRVDPLFVIDLADPTAPKIIGQLKIPGFSDYLHPYDENHIIGFGKDTVDTGERALMQGMKVAVFDVTDPTNPIEKSTMSIGDRGTYSDLLNNHKALLFSKEKNIIAFPVYLYEVPNREKYTPEQLANAYGMFTYQGEYVYSLDENFNFVLKGRVTHGTLQDWQPNYTPDYKYNVYSKYISRGLYIGDTLYTLSDYMLKANSLTDLSEIRAVTFE